MANDYPDVIEIDWIDGIFYIYRSGKIYVYNISSEGDLLFRFIQSGVPFSETDL